MRQENILTRMEECMRFGPALCVPGIFSPPEERETSIHAETELLMEDPELQEAVFNLNYSLAHAWNQNTEDLAWSSFTDRVKFLMNRAHDRLVEIVNEPDFEEHG